MYPIKLSVFDIELEIEKLYCVGNGNTPDETVLTGVIRSSLKEGCPECGKTDCFFDCDGSQMDDSPESEVQARKRIEKNRAYDGIESLILAHACTGMNIETPAYLQGIEEAVEAVENHI